MIKLALYKPQPIKLINYADACEGHYCLGRRTAPGSPYWEFWNEDLRCGAWGSAGTVYVGRDVAKAKRKWLRKKLYWEWRGIDPTPKQLKRPITAAECSPGGSSMFAFQ